MQHFDRSVSRSLHFAQVAKVDLHLHNSVMGNTFLCETVFLEAAVGLVGDGPLNEPSIQGRKHIPPLHVIGFLQQ
jgi:hypothetical protein